MMALAMGQKRLYNVAVVLALGLVALMGLMSVQAQNISFTQLVNNQPVYERYTSIGTQYYSFTYNVTEPTLITFIADGGDNMVYLYSLTDQTLLYSTSFIVTEPGVETFELNVTVYQIPNPNNDALLLQASANPVQALTIEETVPFTLSQTNTFEAYSVSVNPGTPSYLATFIYSESQSDQTTPQLAITNSASPTDCTDSQNCTSNLNTANVEAAANGVYLPIDLSEYYINIGTSLNTAPSPYGYAGNLTTQIVVPTPWNVTMNSSLIFSVPFRGIASFSINMDLFQSTTFENSYFVISLKSAGANLYIGHNYLPTLSTAHEQMAINYPDPSQMSSIPSPFPIFQNAYIPLRNLSAFANSLLYATVESYIFGQSWDDPTNSFTLTASVLYPEKVALGHCSITTVAYSGVKYFNVSVLNTKLIGKNLFIKSELVDNTAPLGLKTYVSYGAVPHEESVSFSSSDIIFPINATGNYYISIALPSTNDIIGGVIYSDEESEEVLFSVGVEFNNTAPASTKVCSGNGYCGIVRSGNLSVTETMCTCDNPAYVGAQCEYICPLHNGLVCGGNGNCVLVGNSAQCVCSNHMIGKACEIECNHDTCSRNGICSYTPDFNITCTCNPGWIGSNCEIECPCDSDRGACQLTKSGNDAECNCFEGYEGSTCNRVVAWSSFGGAQALIVFFCFSLLANAVIIGFYMYNRIQGNSQERARLID